MLLAVAAISAQAQTCKVSATKNNGKIIQISVNLDSLKGKTLVTTISQKKSDVVLNMAYEGDNTDSIAVVAREDSSEAADTLATTGALAKADTLAEADTLGLDSLTTSDAEVSESATGGSTSILGTALNIIGLGGLVSGSQSAQYEEYAAKALTEITMVDSTKYIPQYKQRKWKWLRKYKSYSTLELSGIFGKDFGDNEDKGEEDIDAEDYGMDPEKKFNLGGSAKFSQVFIPGTYAEDGTFKPNRLNFGWSIGALFAVDVQKNYGWSTDFMAKVGIQAGNGLTLGVDALVGGGTTPYAIYSSDGINYRSVLHNQLCFKYGVQVWVSSNFGSNTYTALFARLVRSVAPNSVYEHPTAQFWENELIDFDEGSWQVGIAVGYKFGYNPDLQSKRLQATLSSGYSLTGHDKAMLRVELEKINQISPKLDFSYGLGFGQTLGEERLKHLTINGGWFYRLKPTHKFGYIAKVYAGFGEFMITKNLCSEDGEFEMSHTVRKLGLMGGTNLGVGFRFKCSTISATMRIGYHYCFSPEYNGYETNIDTGLRGWDIAPMIGYTLNF